jgi:hypothetical protein
MAVISTFTREIAEHSTPAIEGLIREAILRDTAVALDAVPLDNNAATVIRPAGLRLVQQWCPTAAGAAPSSFGDMKALGARRRSPSTTSGRRSSSQRRNQDGGFLGLHHDR